MRRLAALAIVTVAAGSALGASAASLGVTTQTLQGNRTCAVSGFPTNATALIDNWVKEDKPVESRFGDSRLTVQSKAGENWRGFTRFDLSVCSPAIPPTAEVVSASLRYFVETAPSSTRTYVVAPVSASWDSTQTWSNQPSVGAGTSTATITAGVKQYAVWDVTSHVQSIVSGTLPNYGWRIVDQTEGGSPDARTEFRSLEGSQEHKTPQLLITYRA